MKVLLLADALAAVREIGGGLRKAGYVVAATRNGAEGLRLAEDREYDLIILDSKLPGVDGLTLLQRLRERRGKTPRILVLAPRENLEERIRGLRLGVDDYLMKSFSLDELLA